MARFGIVLGLACTQPVSGEIIDRTLAVVGGQLIMLSDVRASIQLGFVDVPASGDPTRAALDTLIERHLQLVEVTRFLPQEPTSEQIDQRLAALRARFPTAVQFDAVLAQNGFTLEQLRGRITDDLRIESYLNQRFGSALTPSEADVLALYRARPNAFVRDGVVRPFAEVREEARSLLLRERRVAAIADWLGGLRKRADVTDLYRPK